MIKQKSNAVVRMMKELISKVIILGKKYKVVAKTLRLLKWLSLIERIL